jgi:hypothetical protein
VISHGAMKTNAAEVAGSVPVASSVRPEWIRFPRVGQRDPVFGQSRPTLYRWAAARLIRVAHVRRPGQVRGVSLIDAQSVREFLARCAAGHESTEGFSI